MRWTILAALLVGCGGGEPITAVTFNAGLAEGFVLGASERATVTAEAAMAIEADVMCVQEVWLDDHEQAFIDAAGDAYPHRLFMEPSPDAGDGPACDGNDLDDLFECYEDNCAGGCIDETADCLLANCPLPFIQLPQECIGCLEANVANPDTARETCETEDTKYAYGGSFGIGILSAHPFLETAEVVLDSTTNRRGTLHARIDHPDGPVDVFCTHLTADLAPLPYTGPEDNWIAEQATQVDAARNWVNGQRGDGLAIWMGDFNNGPSGSGFNAELPENYDALVDGWTVPFVDDSPTCTYCPDNALIGSSGNGVVIDHVLVAGADDAEFTTERILDENMDVPSCGDTISAPPSDHYGVLVTIEQ